MVGFKINTPQINNKKESLKKVNRERFEFIMDAERDKKIIEHLNNQPNKAEYIRQLILKDINK